MAQYKYQGRDHNGKTVQGIIEAQNETVAADNLMRRNIIPFDVHEIKGVVGSEESKLADFFEPKVGADELIIFSRQMYSLMKAGIPIIRAMVGLADSTSHKRFRKALLDIAQQLEQGRNLSAAMASHGEIFNRLMVSIVVVGESTGRLEEAFLQLAEYFERDQETRKQIKSAMRYPTFVVIALVVAMFILNLAVIPQFASMFAKFNAELPLMTRILISTSNFFVNYWYLVVFSMVGAVVAAHRYINTEAGRLNWDKRKLKLPIVGDIINRSLLARFSRSFAMVLRSGVPMTSGLSLVAEAADNAYMEGKVIDMRRGIEKGESLLRVSRNSELFSQLVLQMIAVGEETGQVDELLQEAAEFYEREVDFDLKSLTAKIEPILISIVAGMVLVLALGIFTPMWDMMSAIKG